MLKVIKLRVNPDRIAIGGDSAGSKLRINPDSIAICGDSAGSKIIMNPDHIAMEAKGLEVR